MKRENMLIEAEELLKKIGNENLRIFDATITEDAYMQGHIPGAVYFNHDRFSLPDSPYMCTILPVDRLMEQIGRAGISNDSEVVVYACGMLPYAIRAWWVLRYAGHDKVRVLNGGFTAWKNAGGATEQAPQSYEPAVFKGNPRPEMFADKDEVFAAMENQEVDLVNVLPPVSYEAAHIPNSINLSCMDLMDGLEYLRPNDQLALHLKETPGNHRVITYCGGGIAATVNAAAHLLTGHENVAVYDGSMYEWLGEGMPVTGNGNWEIWKLK
ncbi:MAG: sulfurtransferase [Anaerolineales bacterium]|nr:sulfurtransferase [Anaerolineales bacterium]